MTFLLSTLLFGLSMVCLYSGRTLSCGDQPWHGLPSIVRGFRLAGATSAIAGAALLLPDGVIHPSDVLMLLTITGLAYASASLMIAWGSWLLTTDIFYLDAAWKTDHPVWKLRNLRDPAGSVTPSGDRSDRSPPPD